MTLFEFHVSRRARDFYSFDEALFSFNGNVIFANFYAARVFAQKINAKRPPERSVRAGQINALGLIDELQHYVVRAYREQKNPRVMGEALAWLTEQIGAAEVEQTLRRFVAEFPPVAVYKQTLTIDEYLTSETGGLAHRSQTLEEMLMLWLANLNPAFQPFKELFDDKPLEKDTAYPLMMTGLREFFAAQPAFGLANQNLIDLLRAPALVAPDSLAAQLDFMRGRWGIALGRLVQRVLGSLDFIREEEKAVFTGPGPVHVPVFGPASQQASLALFGSGAIERAPEPEPENFSPDLDWMPNLVLIAKHSYVWLDQLSKKYRRAITRLDQIPDAELDQLRQWGVTGLWLIGLWERSRASQRIKQMMGNPEAVASAYSLLDYSIAADLGGDAALQDLKARARQRGIRLASDMVPNHMGIDSKWVVEHPEWFIALDYPPFPTYSFNGPDLSWDARVGIQIEDHYFDRTDAAVVFKRIDKWTGGVKYIYHGNDGTSLPWNDTAQLDYLKAEVREAVIQTILHVARNFPVIRFDAAMTLAKRHCQRLWFPEPGTGGAIPSRAEHGLTKEQFDAAMPEEFWREVVDRVAAEAPDTLLLAEAFWLMEGYFVRTLGMHRVYNSAFMNLLRDEENAKYRSVMKNTLEFDPEVLRRYVNFMNNPDEKTAIEQFGDGNKYFGICTLMATLPGLPMVGHGQVEGFTEKYGMEYRRAYYDETPKGWLVDRHAREIFPLFHQRHLFAGVENFLLYDVYLANGRVDENVFAYSNAVGDERSLVVYHNKFADTRGWIRASAAFAVRTGNGDEKVLVQKELHDGLRLVNDPDRWIVFRDQISGLEYIRNSRELCEHGFFIELDAYKCCVFMNFREVQDDETRRYAKLAEYLKGGGVPDLAEAAREAFARPVQAPFKELVNAGFFTWLLEKRVTDPAAESEAAVGEQVEMKAQHVVDGIQYLLGIEPADTPRAAPAATRSDFEAILQLPIVAARFPLPEEHEYAAALRYLLAGLTSPSALVVEDVAPVQEPETKSATVIGDMLAWLTLLGWAGVRSLGQVQTDQASTTAQPAAQQSRIWIDEWLLDRLTAAALREAGLDEASVWQAVAAIKVLTTHQQWHATTTQPASRECHSERSEESLARPTLLPATGDASRLARLGTHAVQCSRDTLERAARLAEALFADADAQQLLQVNEYQGVVYFNQEAFDRLLWWLLAVAVIDVTANPDAVADDVPAAIVAAYEVIEALQDAEAVSGYQVEKLKAALIERP
jgi:glycosidase